MATREELKAEAELNAVLRLRELMVVDFPAGDPVSRRPPAPDVILEGSRPRVGIEVTALAWGSLREYGTEANTLGAAIVQEWNRRGLPPALLSLHWARSPKVAKAKARDEAAAIVQALLAVARIGPTIPRKGIFLTSELGSALPDLFSASIDPHHETTLFRPSGGGAVPALDLGDPLEYIQPRVDCKEESVPDYRKHCDEVWLLVVSGLPLPNYITGDLDGPAPAVVSSFDRVFLLREIHGDFIEFPVSRPTTTGAG